MRFRQLLRFGASVLVLAALLVLFVLATVAGAASTEKVVDDLTNTAQLVGWIGGVVIPFAVALLTKYAAAPMLKSAVAVVSAAALALGAYLFDFNGASTWAGGFSVFVIALVAAAASRVTVTGGLDTKLALATQHSGLGKAA